MKKKKLYCCFVDYSKAFDMVPRVHLWQKVLSCNVNGKILTVVKNLYQSAKSAVRLNTETGSYFKCMMGVRQGDNLSPLLFELYLNDLLQFLRKAYSGLDTVCKLTQEYVQDDDTSLFKTVCTVVR